MSPAMPNSIVARAIWHLEHNPQEIRSLAALARMCGVSPFHLSRAFMTGTGWSPMRYRRVRILSEAALGLARPGARVLPVALAAGYENHAAFSRAFRRVCGCTPESVVSGRATPTLTEAIRMIPESTPPAAPPQVRTLPALKLLGLSGRFDNDTLPGIPALWQRFNDWEGDFPEEIGRHAYGAMWNFDGKGGFDYLAAARVVGFDGADAQLTRLEVPARDYLVFRHEGHVSGIGRTIAWAWSEGICAAGRRIVPGAGHINFELYGAEFDVTTGLGVTEYWVPVLPED